MGVDLQKDGFHLVFLGIGDNPQDLCVFPAVLKEVILVENQLEFFFLREKSGHVCSKCLDQIHQGRKGRCGKVVFQLGDKALGQFTAACKLFLRKAVLNPELTNSLSDIHGLRTSSCLKLLNKKGRIIKPVTIIHKIKCFARGKFQEFLPLSSKSHQIYAFQ